MSSDFGVNEFLNERPREGVACVSDILTQGVRINWEEGVAVWLGVLETMVAAGRHEGPIPTFDHVIIERDGGVVVEATRSGDRGPVAAGRALHALLSTTDVPVALRLFVTQANSPDTHASIAAFAQGLAYFGRPERAELIRAIYERYRASSPVTSTAPRAATVPPLPPPVAAAPTQPSSTRPTSMRWLMPTAAVICVASLSAALWLGFVAEGRDQGGPAAAPAEAPLAETSTGAGTSPTAESIATPETAPDQQRPVSQPAKPRPRPNRVMPASLGSAERVTAPTTLSDVLLSTAVDAALPAPKVSTDVTETEAAPAAVRVAARDTVTIYSGTDADVQPPVMQQPALPPPVFVGNGADSLVNRMELLIAADGSVERVRLLNAPTRMPDMMLLSGAKLWKFTPALKDGVPVRYRTTVTWTGFP